MPYIFSQMKESTIQMGHLNAHHVAWGSATNKNGNTLVTVIENLKLVIGNDGTDTHLRAPHFNPSPPDLTLISTDLAPHATW